MRLQSILALAAACLLPLARPADAQSYQPHSVQGSLFATTIRLSGVSARGLGFEAQYRYNRALVSSKGVVSVGLGGQFTRHNFSEETFQISGGFIEPRFVLAVNSERLFPYIALRAAVLRQSSDIITATTGWAVGGGAGLAYVMNRRTNIDLGIALVRQRFADGTVVETSQPYVFPAFFGYAAKLGVSVGL